MPTEKADVFTLARFGDIESFKKKFILEEINKKSDSGNGLLHYSIAGDKFDISLFLKNIEYQALENGERTHPNYDANAIIEWLNNVRFKKGISKAKLITKPRLKVKKNLYY